jgi:WD repeat-containing protein 68
MTESTKKEIYTYNAPWTIYGMNWSIRPDQKFRLAIGSFLEDYTNKVEVIQLNEDTGTFQTRGSFDHPYPATKIAYCFSTPIVD